MDAETLLKVVDGELTRRLAVNKASAQHVYFYNIVWKCLEEDDSRRALITAVEFLAPGSSKAVQIRRMLGLAADDLTEGDALHIEALLRRCPADNLAHLYHVAAGSASGLFPIGLRSASEVFAYLVDLNTRRGALAPHLRFVALQIRNLVYREGPSHPDLVLELRHWMYQQCDRLRESGDQEAATELDRLLRQPPAFQAHDDFPICLVVEIEPLPVPYDERNLHRVTSWRQVDQTAWCPVREADEILPFTEVVPHVLRLVRDAEEGWGYGVRGPLVVEFLLSPELINLAVDQWSTPTTGALPPRALGMDYEIVLRSGVRLRPRHRHARWLNRWERLMTIGGETHLMSLEDAADLGAVHGELLAGDHLVACVLSGPPDREPGRSELAAAIDAGLPIVLWCRDVTINGEFRHALRDALHPVQLKKLPSNITSLRSSAIAPGGDMHVCRHVSLLWDDPNHRIPESDPLTSPSR